MKKRITTEDAVIVKETLYFASSDTNELFACDLKSGSVKKLVNFSGELSCGKRLFGSVQTDGNKLYFIPFTAKKLAIYDIEFNSVEMYELPVEISSKKVKCMPSCIIGDKIYFLAIYSEQLFCLDTNTLKITVEAEWKSLLDEISIYDISDAYFRQQIEVIDGTIYVPMCNSNSIWTYDTISKKCRIHQFSKNENGYSGIIRSGNVMYCSPRKKGQKGIAWNFVDNSFEYISVASDVPVAIALHNGIPQYMYASDYSFARCDKKYGKIFFDEKRSCFVLSGKKERCYDISRKMTLSEYVEDNMIISEDNLNDLSEFISEVLE